MCSPPPWACQNCVPSITAAEQLISVPRFFWAGHKARLDAHRQKGDEDRHAIDRGDQARGPKAVDVADSRSRQPNICRTCSQNMAKLSDVKASDADHHQHRRRHADGKPQQPAVPIKAAPQRQQKQREVIAADRQPHQRAGDHRPAIGFHRPNQQGRRQHVIRPGRSSGPCRGASNRAWPRRCRCGCCRNAESRSAPSRSPPPGGPKSPSCGRWPSAPRRAGRRALAAFAAACRRQTASASKSPAANATADSPARDWPGCGPRASADSKWLTCWALRAPTRSSAVSLLLMTLAIKKIKQRRADERHAADRQIRLQQRPADHQADPDSSRTRKQPLTTNSQT